MPTTLTKLSRSDLILLNHLPLIAAARTYASAGWPVLPLAPKAKKPLTLHGLSDASTDLDRISAWWAQTPTANIGLLTGVIFDVLDVDGPTGVDSLRELVSDYHHAGPVSSTGKGWHLLFATSGAPNGANLQPKLDYRGSRGYIAAPPSVHPNGNRYRWDRGNLEAPLPGPPDWLRDLVMPAPRQLGPHLPLSPSTLHAASFLDIVEEFTENNVQLLANGPYYRARCPWHDDDTPSLWVYPDNQTFYCFGCGVWGDALDIRRWDGKGPLKK